MKNVKRLLACFTRLEKLDFYGNQKEAHPKKNYFKGDET